MGETNPDQPFRDYAGFLRERYGDVVHRVPLDLGLSCPNRGADGSGGCTFCGARGARAVHLGDEVPPLSEQVRRGIEFARSRYGATSFMAYFQAFTATYGPANTLRQLYGEALAAGEFRAVSIATRPDCLPDETLDLLAELAKTYDLWVELGVQTIHDETLKTIRRGHDAACAEQAAHRLAERGIPVVPHIVLGLPGEEVEHYRETARQLAGWPCAGIKVHNLHIVEGSDLARSWREGTVEVMDEHQYAAALIEVLRRIPASWPVLRLASDTPRQCLLAPHWWLDKVKFRQYVERQMHEHGWRQGDLLTPKPVRKTGRGITGKTQPMRLPDITVTPEPHANAARALLDAVQLPEPIEEHAYAVLDMGFGLDTLVVDALPDLLEAAGEHRLRIIGFGEDRSLVDVMRQRHPEFDRQLSFLGAGIDVRDGRGRARVYWGDPRRHLFRLRGRANVVLVEPRAVEANVALFSREILRRLGRLMDEPSVLLANSGSEVLRAALLRMGMTVGTADATQISGGGTVASWSPESILNPLSQEQTDACLHTLAGVPYRDRTLTWPPARIREHRDQVIARLQACAQRHGNQPDPTP
jgi:radical SAM protein (TIGR01212 family)